VAKELELQRLGTQIYAAILGFKNERYTGQLQFHLTYNKGGVSRVIMLTSTPFDYDENIPIQTQLNPQMQGAQQAAAPGAPSQARKAPPIGIIASMSKRE